MVECFLLRSLELVMHPSLVHLLLPCLTPFPRKTSHSIIHTEMIASSLHTLGMQLLQDLDSQWPCALPGLSASSAPGTACGMRRRSVCGMCGDLSCDDVQCWQCRAQVQPSTHTHTHTRISKQQNHQQDRFNSTADIDNYVTVSSKMDFLTNSAKSAFHIYLMCSQP